MRTASIHQLTVPFTARDEGRNRSERESADEPT